MPFEFAENGSEVSIDDMILKIKRNVAWMIIQGNGTIFEERVMSGLLQTFRLSLQFNWNHKTSHV